MKGTVNDSPGPWIRARHVCSTRRVFSFEERATTASLTITEVNRVVDMVTRFPFNFLLIVYCVTLFALDRKGKSDKCNNRWEHRYRPAYICRPTFSSDIISMSVKDYMYTSENFQPQLVLVSAVLTVVKDIKVAC